MCSELISQAFSIAPASAAGEDSPCVTLTLLLALRTRVEVSLYDGWCSWCLIKTIFRDMLLGNLSPNSPQPYIAIIQHESFTSCLVGRTCVICAKATGIASKDMTHTAGSYNTTQSMNFPIMGLQPLQSSHRDVL
jgi:hypothetical protein